MLKLPRRVEEASCCRPLEFNPGMEIAGKRLEMSSKSPKLNRQQVSFGRE